MHNPYGLDIDGLKLLDFYQVNVLAWLAELMKHRDSADSRRCRMLVKKFIGKYSTESGRKMMKIVCFHNPNEENGYLSNWYLADFEADGIKFSSMEQYMMYHKAICFHDTKAADKILDTYDVGRIKELGRLVKGYNDNCWNGVRQIIVYEGLLEKFSQNPELKELLKNTGNAVLAECAVKDRIWGIGLSMQDPYRFERSKWKGQNLLGYALMMVRDKL